MVRGPNAGLQMPLVNLAGVQHVPNGPLPVESPPGIRESVPTVAVGHFHVDVIVVHGVAPQGVVLVVAELGGVQRAEDREGVDAVHDRVGSAAHGVDGGHFGGFRGWAAPVDLLGFHRVMEHVEHLG